MFGWRAGLCSAAWGLRATATSSPSSPSRGAARGSSGPTAPPTELRLTEELGRPAVVNRAVAGLPEEIGWVAVVDPGVAWAPGALERLRAAAAPRAGLLGPLLRDPTRRPIPSCGPRPALGPLLRGRVLAQPTVAARPDGSTAAAC